VPLAIGAELVIPSRINALGFDAERGLKPLHAFGFVFRYAIAVEVTKAEVVLRRRISVLCFGFNFLKQFAISLCLLCRYANQHCEQKQKRSCQSAYFHVRRLVGSNSLASTARVETFFYKSTAHNLQSVTVGGSFFDMKIEFYQTAYGENIARLDLQVNELIFAGWQPLGNPYVIGSTVDGVHGGDICQAMVLDSNAMDKMKKETAAALQEGKWEIVPTDKSF
jgi:hypothetical protein